MSPGQQSITVEIKRFNTPAHQHRESQLIRTFTCSAFSRRPDAKRLLYTIIHNFWALEGAKGLAQGPDNFRDLGLLCFIPLRSSCWWSGGRIQRSGSLRCRTAAEPRWAIRPPPLSSTTDNRQFRATPVQASAYLCPCGGCSESFPVWFKVNGYSTLALFSDEMLSFLCSNGSTKGFFFSTRGPPGALWVICDVTVIQNPVGLVGRQGYTLYTLILIIYIPYIPYIVI